MNPEVISLSVSDKPVFVFATTWNYFIKFEIIYVKY